jgi:hypothetical protein
MIMESAVLSYAPMSQPEPCGRTQPTPSTVCFAKVSVSKRIGWYGRPQSSWMQVWPEYTPAPMQTVSPVLTRSGA